MDNINKKLSFVFAPKMREQLESERRRGEAELRGEIRKEMDKLREEAAEVQVNVTLMIVMVMMVMMVMMMVEGRD